MTDDQVGRYEELERLVAQLRGEVDELRTTELDAAELQRRLTELSELASRAAAALESASG